MSSTTVTETAQQKPFNGIVKDSIGLHVQSKNVEGTPLPGYTVIVGTTDADAKQGTATDQKGIYGFFAYEHTSKPFRPSTVLDAYKAGDQATVINGPGIIIVGYLNSGTVKKGDTLEGGNNGGLIPLADGVPIAKAEESATGPTRILIRSLI
ncbi:MAG: hypothetical protein FWD52_00370 [Candidatus Bathyarchaeota archaeon]|nr:hypothetical protein [Candidatus Termiticorpusculum sp.]